MLIDSLNIAVSSFYLFIFEVMKPNQITFWYFQALERINVRARSEENKIPLEYLNQLHSHHEDWLIHKKYPLPAPVLVIDADKVNFTA